MKVWYTLAWGYPEPEYTAAPRSMNKIADENAAHFMRAKMQADELPREDGGATWHVLKIEIVQ